MGFLKHIFLYALCGVLVAGLCNAAHAATMQLPEQKIKAGLVYNFVKFTEWPDDVFRTDNTALEICLLGGDSFNGALDPLQGRTAQMRPIDIRKINRLDNLAYCHTVFIHRSEEDNLDAILAEVGKYPVLSISDIPEFSRKGGMVELSSPDGKRIHLYINQDTIEQAGLVVGHSLVKLAEKR